MKTLVLWIDAINKSVISERSMPFLSSLIKQYGIGELKQSFGYVSISGSFFTGLNPDKHNELVLYKRGKRERDLILELLPKKLKSYYFNFKRYLKGDDYLAPFIDKKEFILSKDKNYHHHNALKFKTLFDYLLENGVPFLYSQWPLIANNKTTWLSLTKNKDLSRVKKFIKLINEKTDFYFLHLWDMDKCGHEYGPDTAFYKLKLKDHDDLIKKVISKFDLEKDNVIIWSDHGMLNVKSGLDLKSKLPKREDYTYFLDSTMARFWFDNSEAKKDVLKVLKSIKWGHVLSSKEKVLHKINFSHNEYGDEIFLVNPGIIISPNFFQKTAKGMHGYDLSNKKELGIFLVNKKVKKKGNLVDLCPTILELLRIKHKKLDGKSLLLK